MILIVFIVFSLILMIYRRRCWRRRVWKLSAASGRPPSPHLSPPPSRIRIAGRFRIAKSSMTKMKTTESWLSLPQPSNSCATFDGSLSVLHTTKRYSHWRRHRDSLLTSSYSLHRGIQTRLSQPWRQAQRCMSCLTGCQSTRRRMASSC